VHPEPDNKPKEEGKEKTKTMRKEKKKKKRKMRSVWLKYSSTVINAFFKISKSMPFPRLSRGARSSNFI